MASGQEKSAMWDSVSVAGKPVDVFVPRSGVGNEAVLYLHGYGGETLRENSTYTRLFEAFQLPVVSPRTGPSWWLDSISPQFDPGRTPHQYLLQEVVPWIRSEWQINVPRIGLLGVSMGGQGVLNLAYRNALRFPVVAAISAAIDFDQAYGKGFGIESIFPSAETARQETAVLHLHPLNWPKHQFFCSDPQDAFWHAGSERLASKLSSSGVPFTSDLKTSHGGHGWPYFDAMAETVVGFLARSLREQGRDQRA